MKKICISLIMATVTSLISGQEVHLNESPRNQYKTSIGIKGGSPYYDFGGAALSIKHFLLGMNAIEVNLGGNAYSLWAQAFYERNYKLENGFEMYWGLGGDIGGWSSRVYYFYPDSKLEETRQGGLAVGADSALGLEYTFVDIPINLAIDTGPTIRLYPDSGLGIRGGFAIRYALY